MLGHPVWSISVRNEKYLPSQPTHRLSIFPSMVNELLHSQWHGDQANRQIAERHVDNEEIASGSGLGVADDHVTHAAVAQNAQYNK